jgi:hypothetical protein
MNSHPLDDLPTDMMCRRSALDLCGRFLFLGSTVTISTNCASILVAAQQAGFVLLSGTEQGPGMRWEIVGTPSGAVMVEDWECNETLDDHALYLSMGPEQWFALDLDTYEGAGFVVVSDPDRPRDPNAGLYLLAVAYKVEACLSTELKKSR